MHDTAERWAVILAGGDGTRLRALTREISGDDRPKQFCPVLGGETLLDQTRRRVARAVSPRHTLLVVTRHHERFYAPMAAGLPPQTLVVQPESRGTAPAILYALCRVAQRPGASVAIFPSDHYVSDDAAFMAHVEEAFDAATARPDRVVLLGIEPDRPEAEYGWIEPDAPLDGLGRLSGAVYAVGRFWEKPAPGLAETLRLRGSLWNSFVMVGRASALFSLVWAAAPELFAAFAGVRTRLGTPAEAEAIRDVYAGLPAIDFSRQVLATEAGRLAVLPVSGVGWNDLGDPRRVRATQAREARRWAVPARPLALAHG